MFNLNDAQKKHSHLLALLPQTDQKSCENLDSIFGHAELPGGGKNPAYGKAALCLDDGNEQSRGEVKLAFKEFHFLHGGKEYLAKPEQWQWHSIILAQYARLRKTCAALVGPAGTGKTHELVTLAGKWDGNLWYLCPSNVACEVVRSAERDRNLGDPTDVSTPHSRFKLSGQYGWTGFPKWWPDAPNQFNTTKTRLYILDEVFFWDARTLALALACIPTGSIVVFAGDPRQNRPVDGSEPAYWLHNDTTFTVQVPKDASAADMILRFSGREAALPFAAEAALRNNPPDKTLSLALTQIRRSTDESIACAHKYLFDQQKLPPGSEGFKVTRTASLSDAVKLAVQRVRKGYRVVCPTNVLALRVGGEINRAENLKGSLESLDLEGVEKPEDALADALYFKKGQKCMVLFNDHSSGLQNGLVCTYVRWHRPDGRSSQSWHVVELPPTKTALGWAQGKRVKVFYTPGKSADIMRRSLDTLRAEIADDQFIGESLGFEQEDACRGLLCSPYALTNHRAQGSTYEKTVVIIPPWLGPWMCAEWLYVAISRSKTAVELVFADNPRLPPAGRELGFAQRVERLTTSAPHAPNIFAALRKDKPLETAKPIAA